MILLLVGGATVAVVAALAIPARFAAPPRAVAPPHAPPSRTAPSRPATSIALHAHATAAIVPATAPTARMSATPAPPSRVPVASSPVSTSASATALPPSPSPTNSRVAPTAPRAAPSRTPLSTTPATATPTQTPVPPTPTPTLTVTRGVATATRAAGPSRPRPTATAATPPARATAAPRFCAGAVPPCSAPAALPGTLLIADRGNDRLIEVNATGQIVWTFPRPGDLRPGQAFLGPDDAFFTPDWRAIITNQEEAQTVGRIDYRTHRLVWQYGHAGMRGSAAGYLNEPDDAYPLRNGLVSVADIRNCRILFLSPAGAIVHQYGLTGVCAHDPPRTYALPNGDTPLPDGGMLVTEITGSHVVRLSAAGHVLFDLALPWVAYPSDAQLLADGGVLLADYSQPGGIVRVSARGRLLWRYAPARASDLLNHPSLAIMLPNGLIAANDDWNDRVVLIDPRRQAIVWQYGVTGVPGSAPGYLNIPDGIDFH